MALDNSLKQLREAIYQRLIGLNGLGENSVFFITAPQTTPMPYLVITPMAYTGTRDTEPRNFARVTYLFSIYGHTFTELEMLAAAVKAGFEHKESELSALMPDYDVLNIVLEYDSATLAENEIWQYLLRYEILITEK